MESSARPLEPWALYLGDTAPDHSRHARFPPEKSSGGAPLSPPTPGPLPISQPDGGRVRASPPPAQARLRGSRSPPRRAGARPGGTRAAEPFAWKFAHATEGASGCSETTVVSQEQRLGSHKSQATHFSPAPLLGSGKTQAGLWHSVLLYFAEGQAAPRAGIWGRVLRWALPSAAPMQGPRITRNPQTGLDLQRKRFACCRVRVDPHGAKETAQI